MYQFVHVEAYSRTPPKTAQTANKKSGKTSAKKGGHCVKYIVDEAIREANSIPHIDHPQPPTHLFGEPLEALEATCETWAAEMKDSQGRKLRKDALCLAAGVISAPHDIEQKAWEKFEADSLNWLKNKYGSALRTVIAHHDESHPHLHFYVVPEPGQRFETIHQGKAAAAAAKQQPGTKKGGENQAYKQAMREFQDEFFDAVGIENGMTRIGPGKRRLTREEWKLEQIQAASAAHAIGKAGDLVEVSEVQSRQIVEEAKFIAKNVAEESLKKADLVEKQAQKKGFMQGILDFEGQKWWQKVGRVVVNAVRERDAYKARVETLEETNKTLLGKAREFFRLGKKYKSELDKVKPRLKTVESELLVTERKAKEVDQVKEENAQLRDDLARAEGRVQHLGAMLESLNEPTPAELEQQRRERAQRHGKEREEADSLER